jgi:hypothetical protein
MRALALLMEHLHKGENDMVGKLRRVAHQHATDFDVQHGATQLSRWSREHVARLAEAGKRFDLDLSSQADEGPGGDGIIGQVLEKTAKVIGRRPEPALLLLRDLRELHLCAAGNNLDWEMLSQAAKALKDAPLLELTKACQSQTIRQMQWSNTLIKELSPQALTSLSDSSSEEVKQ